MAGLPTSVPGATANPSKQRTLWLERLIPWLWAGPAILITLIFLVWPVLSTIWLSLYDFDSSAFVGLKNFGFIFTSPDLLTVLRNNILWLIFATLFTVLFGLIIAVLVDRVRIESIIKSTIFIPMAISFVGASVIWLFVYAYSPKGTSQIGLFNALLTGLGGSPVAVLQTTSINNFALMVIYIWMWTGFCMVILSAALKGIPSDLIEAARVDGANEFQIFFRVIVPVISPTIAVVITTMLINVLKIFDIVYATTGGNYNTGVVAMSYYQELFNFNDNGIANALAVILLLAVVPIMYVNLRRFRAQEAQR
ncbi:MAG TPA: sugar ABC transporter permease [Ktedonobacterales bacterium]